MKTGSGITKLLQQIQASEDTRFSYDEVALGKAVVKNNSAYANVVIKILSGLGGFLATLAFLGFLFVAGLYKSEEGMALVGIVFIGLALGGSRMADHSFFDTVALTLYLSGYVLVATGVGMLLHGTGAPIVLIFMLISALGIFVAKGFMMVMLSVLIFNGSFFAIFPFSIFTGMYY